MTTIVPPADIRSAEILGTIRRTFADKGFDGASMQDLARAAGMSVGNFYRYFSSKAAMIEAIVLRDMIEMEQDFARILKSDDPMLQLRLTIMQHITGNDCATETSLWAEITAAALRKPEVAEIVARMETRIQTNLVSVFARATGLAESEAQHRFGAHALLIMMLVKAGSCATSDDPTKAATLKALMERTIDRTLGEISSSDRKA